MGDRFGERWGFLVAALAAVILVLAAAAPARAFTVSGTVYGGSNPLPNTLVEALQDGTATVVDSDTTNGSGQYSLSLAAGTYDLRVTPQIGSGFGDELIQNLVVSGDTGYDIILLGQSSGGLSGILRGYGGNALVAASVSVRDNASGAFIASQTTDAIGRYVFTLPNGTYRLDTTVYSNPNAPSSYSSCYQGGITVSGATSYDFTLPVAQVSGTVSAVSAGVLASARVETSSSYYDSANQRSCYGNETALTNASGFYSTRVMRNFGSDTTSFIVRPPTGQPYSIITSNQAVTGDTTINFALPDASSQGISGILYGTGGNPVASASVRLYSSSFQLLAAATTNASGQYSFNSSDGNYILYFQSSGIVSPYGPLASYSCQRSGVVASGPTVVDFTLPVVQVSGVVTDETPNPVDGATVSVSTNYYDSVSTSCSSNTLVNTNASGAYSLRGLQSSPSAATLIARPPASNTALALVTQSTAIPADLTQNFVLPAAAAHSLSGTVRGHGGNAVEAASVTFYTTNFSGLGTATTDAAGHYNFAIGDGVYIVEANATYGTSPAAPNYYWYCRGYDLTVSGLAQHDFDNPVARVSGRVTDSNGAPVGSVEVVTVGEHTDWDNGVFCYSEDHRTSDAGGLYAPLTTTGPTDFQFTPPSSSGFAPVFVTDLQIDNDRSQVIVLQRLDVTPPDIVSGPSVVHLSDTSVSIVWTTNEASNSRVEFGIGSLTQFVQSNDLTTQHTVTLTGLDADTIYQYRVGSTDASNNGPTYSGSSTFSTEIPPGDIDAPVITGGPQPIFIDPNNAILSWTTDEPSSSVIHYGLTPSLGSTLDGDPGNFTQNHSVLVPGLAPDTTYYYQVESTDPDGNGPTSSTVGNFHTSLQADSSPPAISNVQVTNITDTTITIEWDTDEAATSGVSYNDGVVYHVVNDPNLVLHHVMTLSSLAEDTTYHLTVSSTDAVGNGPSVAGPIDAITGAECFGNTLPCDDHSACTENDVCDGSGGCAGTPISCDDGNSCTVDSCNPMTGCLNPVQPLNSCLRGGKSVLMIKDHLDDQKDRIVWRWLKGNTALALFGAPTSSSEYGLCVFDYAGVPLAVLNAEIAPQTNWTPNSKGFKYIDRYANQDGASKLVLHEDTNGKAKIVFVGEGPDLNLPTTHSTVPLYQSPRVLVQLHNSNGSCWESEFVPPFKKNRNANRYGIFRDVEP